MPTAVDRTGGRRARARPQRAPAPGPPPSEPGRGGRVLRLHLEQLAGELTGVRVVGEELLRDHPGPGLSASHLTPRHGTPRAGAGSRPGPAGRQSGTRSGSRPERTCTVRGTESSDDAVSWRTHRGLPPGAGAA